MIHHARFRYSIFPLLFAALGALAAFPGVANAAGEVTVYTFRAPFQVKPLFDAFTRETGVRVNLVHSWGSATVERIREEGRNSPADVIFTADIARFQEAVAAGVVQGVRSEVLDRNVPAAYRHPDGLWYGLTLYTRTLFASKERVPQGSIKSYEELASDAWKGRICVRSSQHDANVGLLAAMIAHHGEKKAEQWARGLKANLAREPQGNDRAQVRAVMDGECDVALMNHYYLGVMMRTKEESAWADSVYMVFPNQDGHGALMNLSGGVAVAKHAPNRGNALKLLEFLTGELGQRMHTELNNGYPVRPGTPWPGLLESWGKLKMDTLPLAAVAEKREDAVRLFDHVGFQ